jgi:alanyl-tRNA synthetase
MKTRELKEKFIKFFLDRDHQEIPNVSLVPKDDPSALFISAGMHPLVPYLLGEPHPLGKRLVNVQRCLRTADLESVGDTFHHTFFEMLGNWSLGDYFKKEMIPWALEFLTKELGFEKEKLSVTIFKGDDDAPYDQEAEAVWKKVGLPQERIFPLPKKDNWWGPVGETGPCGPDSEIFYDTGKKKCSPNCRPGCGCGKYFELWNLVFMEYERIAGGKYKPLKQKNVDTGMGVERTTAILQGKDDVYQTELFNSIIKKIESLTGRSYNDNQEAMRTIADHLRGATFVLADAVLPSNKDRGYVLRRLIRRAIRFGQQMGITKVFTPTIAKVVINDYQGVYPRLPQNKKSILDSLQSEEERFGQALKRGVAEIKKILAKRKGISGQEAFWLFETFGLPFETINEIAKEEGIEINREEFNKALEVHRKKSRVSIKKKFAGGLAEKSKEAIKFHTATHLFHQALRDVLGDHVQQVGSNITSKRLRFDFTHPEKLTPGQLRKVEAIVNQKIKENLPVKMKMMEVARAKKLGALAFFKEKYGQKVKVYFIGDYSVEVCGGPHVSSTGEIGSVKIIKEESAGAGKRRIYAVAS